MISTARRVEYALGYLGLGLLPEAARELEQVAAEDRFLPSVLSARLDLHTAAQEWDRAADVARRLLVLDESDVAAWVALGCAARRIDGVAEAKRILQEAERLHGVTPAIIAYNLACYTCLLGEITAAKRYLTQACQSDERFKAAALTDPDLETMAEFVRELNAS